MKKIFNLLHLSDFHICNKDNDYLHSVHGMGRYLFGGPALETEYSRLRKAVESKAKDTDWLIITGDITHTGRIADLIEATEFINGIESDLSKHTEKEKKKSLALLPGNHDRYKNKGPNPGNIGPFERKFEKYWNIGQSVQFCTLSEDLRIQAGLADFSLRESDMINIPEIQEWRHQHPSADELKKWISLWGQGCVYEDLLTRLTDESASRIANGWRVIWILHFAPFPPMLGRIGHWKLQLRNEEALIRSARKLGISHIFCGHTHEQDHYDCGGVEVFCAGPSLRDSRLGKAGLFFVQLRADSGRLETVFWEDLRRSRRGYRVAS